MNRIAVAQELLRVAESILAKDCSGANWRDEISDWAQEHGSAADMWMSESDWKKVKGAKQVKSVLTESHGGGGAYDKLQEKVERYLKQGWKLLADEDNIDSAEAILIKR